MYKEENVVRPIIGMNNFSPDDGFQPGPYHQVPKYYAQALDKSGACVVQFPMIRNSENITQYINMIDGLLIPGGEDVAPVQYNEEPHLNLQNVNLTRDEFEMALIKEAMKQGKPILGICRGCQILNVTLGGTLYQDIPSQKENCLQHVQKSAYYERWHKIKIEKGSDFHKLFGDELYTNSVHHQAIKDLSDKLKVVAKTSDGIPEVVESNMEGQFLMGVQFHPEMMYEKYPELIKVFEHFVEVCKK